MRVGGIASAKSPKVQGSEQAPQAAKDFGAAGYRLRATGYRLLISVQYRLLAFCSPFAVPAVPEVVDSAHRFSVRNAARSRRTRRASQRGRRSRGTMVESCALVLAESPNLTLKRGPADVVRAAGQRRRASDSRPFRSAAGDTVRGRIGSTTAGGGRRQHDLEAHRRFRRNSGSSGATPSAGSCPAVSPPSRLPSTRCSAINCSASSGSSRPAAPSNTWAGRSPGPGNAGTTICGSASTNSPFSA